MCVTELVTNIYERSRQAFIGTIREDSWYFYRPVFADAPNNNVKITQVPRKGWHHPKYNRYHDYHHHIHHHADNNCVYGGRGGLLGEGKTLVTPRPTPAPPLLIHCHLFNTWISWYCGKGECSSGKSSILRIILGHWICLCLPLHQGSDLKRSPSPTSP